MTKPSIIEKAKDFGIPHDGVDAAELERLVRRAERLTYMDDDRVEVDNTGGVGEPLILVAKGDDESED